MDQPNIIPLFGVIKTNTNTLESTVPLRQKSFKCEQYFLPDMLFDYGVTLL